MRTQSAVDIYLGGSADRGHHAAAGAASRERAEQGGSAVALRAVAVQLRLLHGARRPHSTHQVCSVPMLYTYFISMCCVFYFTSTRLLYTHEVIVYI